VFSAPAFTASVTTQVERDGKATRDWVALPYIFHSETLETAVGAGIGASGYFQPQSSSFATVLGSSNDSWLAIAAGNDFQWNKSRWFSSFEIIASEYTNNKLYLTVGDTSAGNPAGKNDSPEEAYVRTHNRRDRPFLLISHFDFF